MALAIYVKGGMGRRTVQIAGGGEQAGPVDQLRSANELQREATEDALRRTIVPGLDFEVNALAARSIKCQQATTRSQSRLDDSFPPPEDKYNLLGRDELLKRIRDFFLCGANVALNREFTVFGVQAVKAMRAEDVT